jgi:hypothetical protein
MIRIALLALLLASVPAVAQVGQISTWPPKTIYTASGFTAFLVWTDYGPHTNTVNNQLIWTDYGPHTE